MFRLRSLNQKACIELQDAPYWRWSIIKLGDINGCPTYINKYQCCFHRVKSLFEKTISCCDVK